MDIMSALTAVSKGLDIVRALKDIETKSNDATFKLQMAELHSTLADAKMALSDAREALTEKDIEIRNLKTVQSDKMRVVRYKGYNFGVDDHGVSIGRPFCPACEQKQGLQIQISRATSRHDLCPNCKAIYSGYAYRLPPEYLPKD